MPAKKAAPDTAVAASNPNANASAASVSDKLDGINASGALSYRKVDQLAPMQIFGLPTTAVFPEGSNQVTTSVFDILTTLGKILAATYVATDGKTYNVFDALMTVLESALPPKPAAPVVSEPAPAPARVRGNPHPL